MISFKDRKVLITGSSRGIGKATAIAFAEAGAVVGVHYKSNSHEAQKTLHLLKGEGHILIKKDLTGHNSAREIVDEFVNKTGGLDILINNAGIASAHPIDEVSFEQWQDSWNQIIKTNLTAVADLCFHAVKIMKKSASGRIVNVSSRGAFRGEPDMPAYGASKAGLNALGQSLAKSLAKYNIVVTTIAPGFTETDMGLGSLSEKEKQALLNESPFKRMAKPEEVANAILLMASEGTEHASGAILDFNGASYLRT